VFGAGPAGAAVALRLAEFGHSVVTLERPAAGAGWGGESFGGAIRGPLSALGLWEDFLLAQPIAGYEQRIDWGEVGVADSMLQPHGHSWHVDRSRFDQDLRTALNRRGLPILVCRQLNTVVRSGDGWRVQFDDHGDIFARRLVDATGRTRALARRLGVKPSVHDRLVALVSLVPRNPAFENAMAIGAAREGWWYAAPTPQGHVLAYFTDSDLTPPDLARRMRVVAANSTFAQGRAEDGWLTVGDACASHDPLCGWGVCRALENGVSAADAIRLDLDQDDGSALEAYQRFCRDQFDAYLDGLAERYGYEGRWPDAPFWRRRITAGAARGQPGRSEQTSNGREP
jgi:flavin-dependent dehydrogenase